MPLMDHFFYKSNYFLRHKDQFIAFNIDEGEHRAKDLMHGSIHANSHVESPDESFGLIVQPSLKPRMYSTAS